MRDFMAARQTRSSLRKHMSCAADGRRAGRHPSHPDCGKGFGCQRCDLTLRCDHITARRGNAVGGRGAMFRRALRGGLQGTL